MTSKQTEIDFLNSEIQQANLVLNQQPIQNDQQNMDVQGTTSI